MSIRSLEAFRVRCLHAISSRLNYNDSKSTKDRKVQAEMIKEQGNGSFKAGNYDKAIELYTQAIKLNPSDPTYHTNRAAAYISLKKFHLASNDCQHALTLLSTSISTSTKIKALLRLARCQLALGSPSTTLAILQTILDLESTNSTALQLQEKAQALEGRLRVVDKARKEGRWDIVRKELEVCLGCVEAEGKELPVKWRVWEVEVEVREGKLDEAKIVADNALELHPTSPDLLALRSLIFFLNNKLPQATQDVIAALRLDSKHETARKLRTRIREVERLKEKGNALLGRGELGGAIKKYKKALELVGESAEECKGGPMRAALLFDFATLSSQIPFLQFECHIIALCAVTICLSLTPNSFHALCLRARLYCYLGYFEAAIRDFQNAIANVGGEGSADDVRALAGELKAVEENLKNAKKEDQNGGREHRRKEKKDYYAILGVPKGCGEAEIKRAYKRESLKHHPDKGGDEERFKLLSEAYTVLSDPELRQRYDASEGGNIRTKEDEGFTPPPPPPQPPTPPPQKSNFPSQDAGFIVRALHDYQATEPNELSFHQGEIINVFKTATDGWWTGVGSDGREGVFFFSFVELVEQGTAQARAQGRQEPSGSQCGCGLTSAPPPPPPQQTFIIGHTVLALLDYDATKDNELSFREGDIIFQVEAVSDVWCKGTNEFGNAGFFPADYVQVIL